MRTGSVTQQALRRNPEDRWLLGMSLTTSAGMAEASHPESAGTMRNGNREATV